MGERVLLTGASAFTGMWIAEALAAAGFEVLAPLLRPRDAYDAERLARIARVEAVAEVAFDCPFGSDAFQGLVRSRGVAALAHHAADVTGYRDPGFDSTAAFARNLAHAPATLKLLADHGARAVVVTGTVFEAGEGQGQGPNGSSVGFADSSPASGGASWSPDPPPRSGGGGSTRSGETEGACGDHLAVTPYGLSKTLTNIAFQHHAAWAGLRFGRFVIPSPYGAYEQQRSFPAYLFRSWFAGETPVVRTPLYLRDHLPAPRLAKAYADHLSALLAGPDAAAVRRPSGWIATQGAFAEKVAAEAQRRLGRDCPLGFADQVEFLEPLRRVNSDPAPAVDEAAFWDDYVGWYAG